MSLELLQYKSPSENIHIVTEQIDGITVGRQSIRVVSPLKTWKPCEYILALINLLNRNDPSSEIQRQRLRFSLNNNCANENEGLRHQRAVSAYFTYNPEDETVIIEWGTINSKTGDAKLHTYLNRMIDYRDRANRGMKLSSGHLAKTEDGSYIALFDNLIYPNIERIDPMCPMGKIINTLYSQKNSQGENNFAVVVANGFVQIPAF